jgi:riboflavin kinase/FMN adenylyltransferase
MMFGDRPTVGDLVKPILEVHLLNFNKNIYGEKVSVEFMHKVRDEKKFSNIESLVRNIEKDVKTVEKWFEKQINDAN